MARLQISTADMTTKQAAFVTAYINTGCAGKAALAAGYGSRETGYSILRSATVQAALMEARKRILKTDMQGEALRTLKELLGKQNPPGVRLKAATYILDKGDCAPDQMEAKPLNAMTADELESFIAGAKSALDDRAASAKQGNITINNPDPD